MKPSLALLSLALVLPLGAHADEPKKVIVCTVTTGFRHSSIPVAEKTLQKLADESKAFTIVDFAQQPTVALHQKPPAPRKPELKPDADEKAKAKYENDLKRYDADLKKHQEALAKWTSEDDAQSKTAQAAWDAELKQSLSKLSPENLEAKHIDGVIFANTTGDLPLPDRDGFIRWINNGHAFIAMHSGSDTLHHFPGYIDMLQGEFAGHGAQVPADLIAGDTKHPANGGIGATWDLKQEEMYHIKNQDRAKVRSLWYMRHDPNKTGEVAFFPVSWCRMADRGRVFYTSLGHREDLWSDDPAMKDRKNPVEVSKQYQAHILGGIKWALGLAEGSAEPNPDAK